MVLIYSVPYQFCTLCKLQCAGSSHGIAASSEIAQPSELKSRKTIMIIMQPITEKPALQYNKDTYSIAEQSWCHSLFGIIKSKTFTKYELCTHQVAGLTVAIMVVLELPPRESWMLKSAQRSFSLPISQGHSYWAYHRMKPEKTVSANSDMYNYL